MYTTLFDYLFEITPSIENLAGKLWVAYGGKNNGYGFTFNKKPINYNIVYDNYTYEYTSIEELKNKYNWGLIVTRKDNSKVFLYYRKDKHFLDDRVCYNYFDIKIKTK